MKQKKLGKWALLFVAAFVLPISILFFLPLYLGFPAKHMWILSILSIAVAIGLFKKLTREW